ncbi:MAG TPA: hypothetical protein VGV60_00260 [Candidatus Polarisedimenticolia bacterium]|jgi:hypothetical protein|nr:hypothetical protein [Candidatus Polarisedimenticolia bacterium]
MSRCRVTAVLSGRVVRALMILLSTSLASAAISWAGVAFDISVGLPISDDAKVFLNITNEYYAPPPEVATVVVRRCPHPEDDYPTILFLARASGRPPAEILNLRLSGNSWSAIMYRVHVAPSVLFVGIDRDPGPPYGRAWGYWRNHPRERFVVEDRDFVELTKLQVASRYYRVSPYTVVAERKRGVTVERFAAHRHRANGRADRMEDRRDRAESGEDAGTRKEGKGPKGHGGKPGKPHGNPHDH